MDPAGSNSNDGSSPTDLGGGVGPKLTLAAAFTAVDAGGTINVAPGVYPQATAVTLNKAVAIVGPQNNVDPRPTAPISSTRAIGNANEAQFNVTADVAFVTVSSDNVSIRGIAINRIGTGTSTTADCISTTGLASGNSHDSFYFGYNILQATASVGDDAMNLLSYASPVIEYNYINQWRGSAVKFRGGSNDGSTQRTANALFRYNEVHNTCTAFSSTTQAALFCIGESQDTFILGNRITNSNGCNAIAFGNSGDLALISTVPGGRVVDNVIANASGGIGVSREYVSIQGNEISGITSSAGTGMGAIRIRPFLLTLMTNISIRDNVLNNSSMSVAQQAGGIVVDGLFLGQATLTIEGNDFTSISPFAINNKSLAAVTASNCYFGGATPTVGSQAPPPAVQSTISTNVNVVPVRTTPLQQMDLNWSAAGLTYGPIAAAATQDLPIDLSNTGNATVPSIPTPGVFITGPDAAKFSFTPPAPTFPVVMGTPGSQTMSFRYSPGGAIGTHTATATLNFFDSVGPVYQATFTLTGTAVLAPAFNDMSVSDPDGMNCEAGFTNNTSVIVTALAPTAGPADQLILSEDPLFGTVQTYSYGGSGNSVVSFNLSSGDGPKTIYGKFSGPAGTSGNDSASITLDTVAPAMSSINVTAEGVMALVYTEDMNAVGTDVPARYTISGPGAGTLSANPSSVIEATPTNYILTWLTGDMVFGGDVTLAINNVHDRAGNPIGSPFTLTDVGGGLPVELSAMSLE